QLSSIFCVLYQHFYHPTPLYPIFFHDTRKRPPFGDLFRQAEPGSFSAWFFVKLAKFIKTNWACAALGMQRARLNANG
ncbi:hypothetical protein, partial [uncultured Allofournierella sp.]|uniref:hypothetical protein n=1 Tax=uncultured Allofournierella sp. TaxID=1940258 RepID=UPI00375327EB